MSLRFLLLISTLISSNAISSNEKLLKDIENYQARWSQNEPDTYQYRVKEGGVFGYKEYKVKINGNRCSAKYKNKGASNNFFWKKASCENIKISSMFEKIRKQLAYEADEIKLFVALDGRLKYFYFEPKGDIEDQDWYIEIYDFKSKSE
jgi:Family of unknown function (DUF6174)